MGESKAAVEANEVSRREFLRLAIISSAMLMGTGSMLDGEQPTPHARLRELAPDGIDALIDTHGGGYVDLAIALGVAPGRIETIADFATAGKVGAHRDGMAALTDQPAAVSEIAGLLASGELELPIKARFPLDRVRDAYRELSERSGLGKIVLDVSAP